MSEGLEALIKEAIENRWAVTCVCDGHYREFCPHAIGAKAGRVRVLAFQFGGQSAEGLPSGGTWQVFDVRDMLDAAPQPGEWHTGPADAQPEDWADEVQIRARP
jgi:hypothetical protein